MANWNTRPRKLIQQEFSISHRTPLDICRLFQEKASFIVANHKDVDQNMYTKAVFRSLHNGLCFVIICFNMPNTSKKKVQQDLVLKMLAVARQLDIEVTFNQSSCYVTREEVATGDFYLGRDNPTRGQVQVTQPGGVDFGSALPKPLPKEAEAQQRWFAPEDQLVVRIAWADLEGPGQDSDSNDEIKPPGETVQQKAGSIRPYRVAINFPTTLKPSDSEWLSSAMWTRPSQPQVSASGQKVPYYENVSFALDKSDPVKGLPKEVVFKLFQVGKGFRSWALQKRWIIGTGTCSVWATVQQSDVTVLELINQDGVAVGRLHVDMFVPKAVADSLGCECRKSLAPSNASSIQPLSLI